MQWHIVRTGRVLVDAGGPFGLVPRALWSKKLKPDEHNHVPMDLNCLLVHSDGKVILVDNGLGDKLDKRGRRNWSIQYPDGTLLGNLKELGVAPEDVDIVIDTHLHWDHCGGNTRIEDGEVVPTFPRAEYLVQYIEWAQAMQPDARTRATYLLDNYRPIWERSQYRFLYGDTHVTDEVRCVVTRGHTRAHQSVIIEGGETPVMYLADLSSYAVHFARAAWVTAYDVEPLETIATKQRWQAWALENNSTLVFEHDTQIPLGRLVKDQEGKLRIQSLHENEL